jgi:hypothetical protein
MKPYVLLLLVLATALIFNGAARAQITGDHTFYFVTYYSNSMQGAPDATVRVVNDGDTNANLWASFYVFDDSQEMQECCSCPITPDGLLSESVQKNLAGNTLTGRLPTRGVIKIISSSVSAVGPATYGNPKDFSNSPAAGLRVWSSHVQRSQSTSGTFYISETEAARSNLIASEQQVMETLCLYINLLGGGVQGVCSCTPEDADF